MLIVCSVAIWKSKSGEMTILFRSIASSAPIFWFIDMSKSVPQDAYNHIVKRSFVNSGCIEKNIFNGWIALKNLSLTGQSSNLPIIGNGLNYSVIN